MANPPVFPRPGFDCLLSFSKRDNHPADLPMITKSFQYLRTIAALFALSIVALLNAGDKRPPNWVILFADNVGYGDLGCYGNRSVKTPNIDRLANEGVRCMDIYVGSPSCMPSRGALLTGRSPVRNGLNEQLWKNVSEEQIGLPHREKLLPQYLKAAGYISGCFGKWNIGFAPGSRPTERGFDEFFGHASGNIDYYSHLYDLRPDLYRGTNSVEVEGYSTDLFTDAACDFIKRNKNKPFFCYLPFNAAHYPNKRNKRPGQNFDWQVPDKYLKLYGSAATERDQKKRYLAVLSSIDDSVGRILKTIDDSKLREQTVVVFLSDNGAFMLPGRGLEVASNYPLRGGGVTLWEGGIRVPCIIRWPDRIPANSTCAEPLSAMDILPMVLKAANVALPEKTIVDGIDPTEVLVGEKASPHSALFFEWGKEIAIRKRNWKLIRRTSNDAWELYDLSSDITETRNLAARFPSIKERLEQELTNWLKNAREEAKE